VTLPELLLVLVLVSLLAAMAGPQMSGWVQAITQRGAANELVADLALARTQAVRQGQTVSFRIDDATSYRITVDDAAGNPVRVLKRVNLARDHKGSSLTRTSGRIAFDSRGMYRSVSTISDLGVTGRGETRTVRVSVVGRIYRD